MHSIDKIIQMGEAMLAMMKKHRAAMSDEEYKVEPKGKLQMSKEQKEDLTRGYRSK